MATTKTGGFGIGFRNNIGPWREKIADAIAFAQEAGFECIDVAADIDQVKAVKGAGLNLGSVDMVQPWSDLTSDDAGKRKDAAARQVQFIKDAVAEGAKVFFAAALPDDPALERIKLHENAVDGYGQVAEGIADTSAVIAFEGWPGGAPYFATLACTPESYRLLINEIGLSNVGVNYDPSHLVRMGIDPLRFLDEFGPHVHHVHGKDTELFEDARYEYGTLQAPVKGKPHGFGSMYWRYTIPGEGASHWTKILSQLEGLNFEGFVSIELEDENYAGDLDAQKQGLTRSLEFLAGV